MLFSVNATRNKLVKVLNSIKTVFTATGAQTKFNRIRLSLPKHHWIDAACVGNVDTLTFRTRQPLRVTCKGQGGRQKAVLNKYGYPVQHRPLKPIKGWNSGDIAKNKLDNSFGVISPRTKGNSYEIRVKGRKPKSTHVKNLIKVHRKDGYSYSFF